MPKTLKERIEEVAGDNIGVFAALIDSEQRLGGRIITQFLDKVPEKNEQLWLRFKRFQAGENGGREFMNFGHFVLSVVMPKKN